TVNAPQPFPCLLPPPLKSTVHTSLGPAALLPLLNRPASLARLRRLFSTSPAQLQNSFEAAFTGHYSMAAAIQFANLARTPAPMSQFQTHYLTHHLIAQLLGMVVRPTRSLRHASHPLTQKTLLPFITRFRADPVFLA